MYLGRSLNRGKVDGSIRGCRGRSLGATFGSKTCCWLDHGTPPRDEESVFSRMLSAARCHKETSLHPLSWLSYSLLRANVGE